ncbi:MAG: hypothetical protein MHMPM18_001572 [Marteilia pararefringens]
MSTCLSRFVNAMNSADKALIKAAIDESITNKQQNILITAINQCYLNSREFANHDLTISVLSAVIEKQNVNHLFNICEFNVLGNLVKITEKSLSERQLLRINSKMNIWRQAFQKTGQELLMNEFLKFENKFCQIFHLNKFEMVTTGPGEAFAKEVKDKCEDIKDTIDQFNYAITSSKESDEVDLGTLVEILKNMFQCTMSYFEDLKKNYAYSPTSFRIIMDSKIVESIESARTALEQYQEQLDRNEIEFEDLISMISKQDILDSNPFNK